MRNRTGTNLTKKTARNQLKFHKECAKVLQQSICSKFHKPPKLKFGTKLYSVITRIIKNKEIYEQIARDINYKVPGDQYLPLVQIHEIINGRFETGDVSTVEVKTLWNSAIEEIENACKYIRVNTLKTDGPFLVDLKNEMVQILSFSPKNELTRFSQVVSNPVFEASSEQINVDINCHARHETVISDPESYYNPDIRAEETTVDSGSMCINNHGLIQADVSGDHNTIQPSSPLDINKNHKLPDSLLSMKMHSKNSETVHSVPQILHANLTSATNDSRSNSEDCSPMIQLLENVTSNDSTGIGDNPNILVQTTIPDVYRVLPKFEITRLSSYLDGRIIIQHLSSCVPAFVLNPSTDSTVIDACAAPGNKTSHLACIMNNTGQIYAYEKNTERFKLLKKMLTKHGVTNTKVFNKDFTDVKKQKIDYVLVDPSCSGSGLHRTYGSKDVERLKRLSHFQKKILTHALMFEGVTAVVYSTCSIYEEENEMVIDAVLLENQDFELRKIEIKGFGAGRDGYTCSKFVLRAEYCPSISSQGFFVAHLVRKQ